MDEGDWEQQMLFGKTELPIPDLASLGHGHISLSQLRQFWPGNAVREYFKFAFVRNPYDRFISTYFFLRRSVREPMNDLDKMKMMLSSPRLNCRVLMVPQYRLLVNDKGECGMDFTGKFEQLQSEYDKICSHLGLSSSNLEKKNASDHGMYKTSFDLELWEMVTEFYRQDFEFFDYKIEPFDASAGLK